MTHIIAIGGGSIGYNSKSTTTKIDKHIIATTKKKHPTLLFIPTASKDSIRYIDAIHNHFGKKLNCNVKILSLTKEKPSKKTIRENIQYADIIYVGGGNTLDMLRNWRKQGIDVFLKQAWQSGTIMSGLSAGAICWFRYGNSDSNKYRKGKKKGLMRISGLNLIPLLACPHYNSEKARKAGLKKQMKKTPGRAIALDDNAAIHIHNNTFKIITSTTKANVYLTYWKNKQYIQEKLQKNKWISSKLLQK